MSQCQSTALVTTLLLTWMSETHKSPQPCELFLVKFCKLRIFFFTYYTARALSLQNDVTWCYEKNLSVFLIIFQKHAQPNGWFGTWQLTVTPLFENGHYTAILKLGCNTSMLWNKDLSLENTQQIIAEVKTLQKIKVW